MNEQTTEQHTPKQKGWVARDKNGKIHFFIEKPFKTFFEEWQSVCSPFATITESMGNPLYKIMIPEEFGFNCRYEDEEPIEVELLVRKLQISNNKTMDYKEKYEKALSVAKKWKDDGISDIGKVIECIFPELVESEDEKNIKGLINELKGSLRAANCQNDACGGGHESRIKLLEWGISWLEKQKTFEWSEEDNEMFQRIISDCEKKYILLPNEVSWLKSLKLRPKQEWSEEDETILQDAIYYINEYQKSNRCKDENDMQNSVTCENWLKSIKLQHHC